MAKPTSPDLVENCWNCGGEEFTNSAKSHHVVKQLICASCYEPQGENEDYYESEDWF